jgi:hypothetical protein
MNQHVKELVQMAKKNNSMPILMKMLPIHRKLFYKNLTDTEIIEKWYEVIHKYWQTTKTLHNTTINDIFKEFINDFKRYIEQYENDLPVW